MIAILVCLTLSYTLRNNLIIIKYIVVIWCGQCWSLISCWMFGDHPTFKVTLHLLGIEEYANEGYLEEESHAKSRLQKE